MICLRASLAFCCKESHFLSIFGISHLVIDLSFLHCELLSLWLCTDLCLDTEQSSIIRCEQSHIRSIGDTSKELYTLSQIFFTGR